MEKYSQYRDRGDSVVDSSVLHGLILSRLWHCAFLPYIDTIFYALFAVSRLSNPFAPADTTLRHFELFLCLAVAAYWIFGKEGFAMAYTWHSGRLVDRFADRRREERVSALRQPEEPCADCHSSLAKHHKARLPQPGSIIACSHTSPLDALYLAAIFDPVFTASYPSTRQVERISLFHAILRALQQPQTDPPRNAKLTDLKTLIQQHPHRAIVVFPECTTTNGRGTLAFSSSLLTTPPGAKIFPISLRYTAPDITTPIPGSYITFLWNLLSKPSHCIRVRIAESVYNQRAPQTEALRDERASSSETLLGSEEGDNMNASEKRVLDRVADALARLGRIKRVALGVKDKQGFVKVWTNQKKR